jgi:hypothetical protein
MRPFFFFFILLLSCNKTKDISLLDKVIEKHGGIENWNSYKTLEFDLERSGVKEHHIVDLKSRKVLITSKEYTIGFDGKDVWIVPNKEALKYPFGPRFYHSIYYYRAATPFIFADPGVNHKKLRNQNIDNKEYNVIKVFYDSEIGDTPNDSYILYVDTKTNELDFLLYTITYNEKAGKKYRAYKYRWQNISGLLLPSEGIPYNNWDEENKILGEASNKRIALFKNMKLKKESLSSEVFNKPEKAFIVSE